MQLLKVGDVLSEAAFVVAVLLGLGFWPASDVYSFGVSFWEALTSRAAHEGESFRVLSQQLAM